MNLVFLYLISLGMAVTGITGGSEEGQEAGVRAPAGRPQYRTFALGLCPAA